MQEILNALPNTEIVSSTPLDVLVKELKPGMNAGELLVCSGDWFNYEAPDYAHFDAYTEAFKAIAGQIDALVGEVAAFTLGFDEETFEPVPLLMKHDIYADFYYYWPASKLLLFSEHEDKELPISLVLMRLS